MLCSMEVGGSPDQANVLIDMSFQVLISELDPLIDNKKSDPLSSVTE